MHLVAKEEQPHNKFKVEPLRIFKKPVTFAKSAIRQDPYNILKDL